MSLPAHEAAGLAAGGGRDEAHDAAGLVLFKVVGGHGGIYPAAEARQRVLEDLAEQLAALGGVLVALRERRPSRSRARSRASPSFS